jgi:hypothetical protein
VSEDALHPDFSEDVPWKGIDLAKVYRQVPISTSPRKFAVLVLHHYETKKPLYFVSRSLSFGASASVFSFRDLSGLFFIWQCHAAA